MAKLRELKEHGIDTLVDLTVIGLGRYIPRVAAIAEQVPEINVVVATGVYTYNEVPMYFHFQGPGTILGGPEPMVDVFVREIREGIGETASGRHPEVRVRPPRHHPRRGARAQSRGAGAPGHRGTHHHAHADTARALGTRAAAHLQGGGRRPDPGRHRPQRGHGEHRLPPESDRQRLVPRLRPLRPAGHHPGGARRRRGPSVRPGLRRAHRPLPRRHVLRRLVPAAP